jgi:hypothetical protein
MMEAAGSCEMLVNFYQTTQRCNPEDSHIRTHRCENLKSYKIVLLLRNCINLLKVVPGSYETYFTSSHDGNQVIHIKAEVTYVPEEGEDAVLITFPVIKAEHEVSCTSVCSLVSKLKNVSDKCRSLPWRTLVSAL